ncbi:MAG: restriction endonuclease [Lachnospiraceae bacterium]|nr:restriction endonuclease [Lachnospiraceae bacterium]
MAYIDNQLKSFKDMIEDAIITGGVAGKTSCIRSSALINLIHDAVKWELIEHSVRKENIRPPFGKTKPEIRMAGLLKQKDQDVCVLPSGIKKKAEKITWGPMAFQDKTDPYGYEYSTNALVINVRSQMSSLAKNTDTILERTFAEALNLHMRYPKIVLGEVFLIPLFEYDDELMKDNKVGFKRSKTNVERYISFFNAINNRALDEEAYKYERCALLIVDFRPEMPILYRNSRQLKDAQIVSDAFDIEYAELGFDTFAEDILRVYADRYAIENIQDIERIRRVISYVKKS